MSKPKSQKKGIKFRKQKKGRTQKSVGTPVFRNVILNCPDQQAFPKLSQTQEISRDFWVAKSII